MTSLAHDLKADLVGNLAFFLRTWRLCTLVLTAVGVLVYLIYAAPEVLARDGFGRLLVSLLFAVLYFGFYAALVALAVALIALTYRLVGLAIVVPFVTVSAAIYLAFWLGEGWVAASGQALLDVLQERWSEPPQWVAGLKVHDPVMLLVVVCFLALTHFLLSWAVISQVFSFLLVVSLLLALGFGLGSLAAAPVLVVALVARYRRRQTA